MFSQISTTQKLLVMVGVMLAMFLAALDQTIVATSLPRIVRDLSGLEHLSWVITAYMLASTVIVPLYGKFSDIHGRKIFVLSAVIIFLIGSALSGASQNMFQLIVFRAIQGLGGGAIFANAFAVIGDLFPPAERGKWTGLIGGVFGLSSVIGPTLGGYLTDNFSWRWNFYINIPIGLLAIAAIYFLMPKIVHEVKDKTIDYWGALFLSVALISFLLGLVGMQSRSDLISQILLFSTAFVSTVVFVLTEREVSSPILPLSLFKNSIFSVSSLLVFLTAFGMFGSIFFIPLFAQIVMGVSATSSGAILTPMMLSVVAGSIVSGQMISRFGKYKLMGILGVGIVSLALYLLSKMTVSTTQGELIVRMIITGIGLGFAMPVYTLAVQNAFEHGKLGVVTAASQLFRSLGGVIGVTLLGSLLNMKLEGKLPGFFGQIQDVQKLQSAGSMQLSNPKFAMVFLKIKEAFASSITEIFFLQVFVLLLALVVSFFLKEIPLRKTHFEGLSEMGADLAEEEGNFPSEKEPVIFKA